MNNEVTVKNRIMDVAEELFLKQGIQVSMLEIATALGMSKNTLYEYFPSKEALLKSVFDKILDTWLVRVNDVFQEDDILGNKINKILNQIANYMRNLAPLTMYNIKKYYPQVYTMFLAEQESRIHDIIEQIVKIGLEDGSIRPMINLEFLNRFIFHTLKMLQDDAVINKMNLSVDQVLTNISTLLVFGVLSEEGREKNIGLLQSV